MNHVTTPPQPVIFQTKNIDEKIYAREQKGQFQKTRRYLNYVLMSFFVLLPFIQFNGQQAVRFDLEKQTLTLFPITLFPHDLLIFSLLFIIAAFLLFYVTRLYGRVWCGYTCPQTIWMLMFNWIERRVEGNHNQSKVLTQSPFSISKATKRFIKHTLWLIVSLFTALIFISYFVPSTQLYRDFFTFEASLLTQAWVYFFMFCTYINGGWIKEKMCLHICPYARFQSVMFNKNTILMTYDNVRGETRGPRQRTKEKPVNKGDCVDCNLCVQVCPVGIDIRNGLQYECINCGLCADACDAVMEKFSYAKGLIKYTSEQQPTSYWRQHISYGVIISMLCLSAILWGINRDTFEVSVIRDRQVLYRINTEGKPENIYTFKTLNKSQFARTFNLTVKHSSLFNIIGESSYTIQPGEHYVNIITVNANRHLSEKTQVTFIVTEQVSQETSTHISAFYSGNDSW